jgi:carbonic anhydrase
MDGRVQLPVNEFLRRRFDAKFVDTITEAGPVKVLASRPDGPEAGAICRRVDISVEAHGSTQVAVVAHHDCAGHPVPDDTQKRRLADAARVLRTRYRRCEIVALWVDEKWRVHEIKGD